MNFPKFFLLDSYFIYIKTSNENYKYSFFKNKEYYYLAILYKKNIPENCDFLILTKNKLEQWVYYKYNIKKNRDALISIGNNWETLRWELCNADFDYGEIQRKINTEYPSLNYDYYTQQILPLLMENRVNVVNKTILYHDLSPYEKIFFAYHWIFEGSKNKCIIFRCIVFQLTIRQLID